MSIWIILQCTTNLKICKKLNEIYGRTSFHKKYFIHYYYVSVSEGLHAELSTSELMLRKFDDKIFQSCGFCHCKIEIKRAFTQEVDTCDYCLKLLENEDQDNPRFILFGQKIENIEFLQTSIVHLSIEYSDMRRLRTNLVKLVKK